MGIFNAAFTEQQLAKFDEMQERADEAIGKYEEVLNNPRTEEEKALVLALSDQVLVYCDKIISLVSEAGERLKTGNV